MSVFRMSMSAGLVATLVGASLMATAPAAKADDRFWGGVAAGAVGGIVGSAIVNGIDGGRAITGPTTHHPHRFIGPIIDRFMRHLATSSGATMNGATATAFRSAPGK